MIRGLTDNQLTFFPRLAKIRLGVKRQGQKGEEFPADVDHFVLSDCQEVAKVYGDKPKSIICMFPSDDPESNFPTRLEAWRGGGKNQPDSKPQKNVLFCSSDGETALRLYVGDRDVQGHNFVKSLPADEDKPDINEIFKMPCPYRSCPYYENRNCKEVGRLNIILPQVTWAGVYQIETSSLWAFGNILDTIRWMQTIYNGDIKLKPFELSRKPVTMNADGRMVIKHVLNMRIIDHHNMPEILPPPFMSKATFFEIKKDLPEDLFPPAAQQGLPPAPSIVDDDFLPDEEPKEIKELREMGREAGIGDGQFDLMLAKCGGEIEKVRREISLKLDKKIQEPPAPKRKPGRPPKEPKLFEDDPPQDTIFDF